MLLSDKLLFRHNQDSTIIGGLKIQRILYWIYESKLYWNSRAGIFINGYYPLWKVEWDYYWVKRYNKMI